jgi:2-methylisocitrate lyase-like PEP mutase family enzyme
VTADFQAGYAETLDELATNVKLCVLTGAAGLSIEDATGNVASPLYQLPDAIERIRAARRAIDETQIPAVLTARCEALLVGDADPVPTILKRLTAYAEAGADCLFAPGIREPELISSIVKEVSPKAVNVIVSSSETGLSLSRLADLGVRRISVGSALARVAWGAFMRASQSIAETGTFDALDGAAQFSMLNDLFHT